MKERTPAARSASLMAQRLAALFVGGWVLFDFPLLSLGLGGGPEGLTPTIAGLPRLPVLLFIGWAVLIAAVAWLMERGGGREEALRPGERPAERPGERAAERADPAGPAGADVPKG